MVFVYIAAALLILYSAATLIISFKCASMVLYPNTHDYEAQIKESVGLKRFTREYIDSIPKENFEVQSEYGYLLHGIIESSPESELPANRTKVAVLCHGYTSGKITMSGYARRLLKLGFTCVMYDHRNHGDNDKSVTTTMGYYEKYDLKTIIDYCYKRFGNDIRILTYGESMGAATVLSLYEIDSRPVLTVADCGYSDLKNLFRIILRDSFHIPPIFPILKIADIFLRHKGHFTMEQVSPRRGVANTQSPILFCHGGADGFIPCAMSEEMSGIGPGVRELYICEGADHAVSEVTKPDEYTSVVTSFIERYY